MCVLLTLPAVFEDAHSLTDVSQVQSGLIVTTHILPDLSYNTEHSTQVTTHTNETARDAKSALHSTAFGTQP